MLARAQPADARSPASSRSKSERCSRRQLLSVNFFWSTSFGFVSTYQGAVRLVLIEMGRWWPAAALVCLLLDPCLPKDPTLGAGGAARLGLHSHQASALDASEMWRHIEAEAASRGHRSTGKGPQCSPRQGNVFCALRGGFSPMPGTQNFKPTPGSKFSRDDLLRAQYYDDDGNRVDPPEDAIAPSPAKGEVDADYVVRMSQRVEPTDWPKGTHGRGSRVAGYGVLCLRP